MAVKIKVKFLKDHVNDIKKGDIGEFNEGRAIYLVSNGFAEYVTGNKLKSKNKQAVENTPCKSC